MIGPLLNLVSSGTDTFTYDTFKVGSNHSTIVTVGCRGSKATNDEITVSGYLSGELEFGVDSKWDPILGGQGSSIPSDILNIPDMVDQMGWGGSIRQPWFSRSVWRGNTPLRLPITMQFLAQEDAKKDVWDPIWDLFKLFLPKLRPANTVGGDPISAATGFLSKAMGISDKDATILSNMVGTFQIPGPSTFYPLNKDASRPMFCRIGNLEGLSLEVCYFTDLKIKMPTVFTEAGYPTYAEATFTVHSQDSTYITADGKLANNVGTLVENALDKTAADAATARQKQADQAVYGNVGNGQKLL